MIWSVAREQLRSQRRYFAWAMGVVALSVGVASYGALMAIELDEAADATNHALVLDTENSGFVGTSVGDTPVQGMDSEPVPFADVEAAIAAAQADGLRVGAQSTLWTVRLEDRTTADDGAPWVTAAWGEIDWQAILTDGTPPGSGEVALSEAYAERLGVGLGDTVNFHINFDSAGGADGRSLDETATVSGLARSPFATAGLSLNALAEVWISADDLTTLVTAETVESGRESAWPTDVIVTWDGHSPELDAILTQHEPSPAGSMAHPGENESAGWVWLAAGVLAAGSIAMAFAFGRAQAQSRTQWVATARALGATRKHVVLGACLEAGVLTLLAAGVGYVFGTVAATAHLAVVHGQVPAAGIASVAAFSPIVALAALALALVLSLVISGVPAFWATRVNPAAALKPDNDITTAHVGRRVRFWPVALMWGAVGIGTFLVGALGSAESTPAAAGLLLLLFVLSPVVANEFLRIAVPQFGRWLSRRPEKTVLVAGELIAARPRQFTVPALLVSIGSGALLTAAMNHVLAGATLEWEEGIYAPSVIENLMLPAWLAPATLIIMGAVIALATVIAVATNTVTEPESATRRALGVSSAQSRAAAGVAHFASLLLGLLVGVVFAAMLSLAQAPLMAAANEYETTKWDWVLNFGVMANALVVGVSVVFSLGSAGLVVAATRSAVPAAHIKQGVSR